MCRGAKLMRGELEMFNFMYHLGWTMVLIYLIKHYSKMSLCRYLWMKFALVYLSKTCIMRVGLMQSL